MDQDGFTQVNNKRGGSRRGGNGGYGGNCGQGGGRNPSHMICSNCGWPSHTAQNCPRNTQRARGSGTGRGGGACHRCGQPGHFIRGCPIPPTGPNQRNQPGRAVSGANVPAGPRNGTQPGRAFSGANVRNTKKEIVKHIYKPNDNAKENAADGYEQIEDNCIGALPDLEELSLEDSNKGSNNEHSEDPKKDIPDNDKRTYPVRPAYGQKGSPVTLRTNYFDITIDRELVIRKYSLAVIPQDKEKEPTGKALERVVNLLVEQHFRDSYYDIATDYSSTLLCRHDLIQGADSADFDVSYAFEHDPEAQEVKIYKVRVTTVKDLRIAQLLDHLQSSTVNASFDGKDEIIQAMNIIFGTQPKGDLDIVTVGANKHFWTQTKDHAELGKGLQAMRGYFLSVRPAVARLLLNVQVKHVACYKTGSLDELMHLHGLDNIDRLGNFLKGARFRPSHLESSGPPKRVWDLARTDDGVHPNKPDVPTYGAGPREVQFYLTSGNGSEGYISVFDYFKRQYPDIQLDPGLPVINYGSKENPRYLPAEVCHIGDCQPCNCKLDPEQTSQMIKFAGRNPRENAKSIVHDGLDVCWADSKNALLRRMQISVVPNLVQLRGRVLQAPNLQYPNSAVVVPRAGSWDARRLNRMGKGANWPPFAILDLSGESADSGRRKASFEVMFSQTGKWGITSSNALGTVSKTINENGDIKKQAEDHLRSTSEKYPQARMIIVILPDVSTQLYNGIKRKGDIDLGIHTVCLVGPQKKKFFEHDTSYMANVLTKLNLKLGGRNQALAGANQLGIISEGNTMVVGIDVTHPSPGSSISAPSIAGMVASVDSTLSQWPAILRIQSQNRSEIVEDLRDMLVSRLCLWKERNNNSLPANILVYRDGVSEGQYNIVINDELPRLQQAVKTMYDGLPNPKISIIIVGKRHNTRFYPTSEEHADNSSNSLAGTIVDRGITQSHNWDFFLQSHTALQGTAKPAHYFVVHDEIFRSKYRAANSPSAADALEDLTHKMCYLFGRATKAVSVCPPAYYADLVCDRARCYLSEVFEGTKKEQVSQAELTAAIKIHRNLANSMFYI